MAGYAHFESRATAGPDGSFCVPGLPGSGVLGAVAPAAEAYRRAQVTVEELVDFSRKYKEPPVPIVNNAATLLVYPGGLIAQRDFHNLTLIHPIEKDKELTQDLVLEPL
jgi:hypothetical protein